jgi:hypothetical protein
MTAVPETWVTVAALLGVVAAVKPPALAPALAVALPAPAPVLAGALVAAAVGLIVGTCRLEGASTVVVNAVGQE